MPIPCFNTRASTYYGASEMYPLDLTFNSTSIKTLLGITWKPELMTMHPKRQATEDRMKLPRGNGETILVVDDEAHMVMLPSMVLELAGYKVISADEGLAALALYREHADEIAAVLTDVMMPKMDGVKLSRELKEVNPQVKIIASTGHASEDQYAELRALGVHVILNKPYDAKMLLTALHEAIHSERV